MNNVTPIPVRLEAFEGPLDLLLHLIDKNKINIYDIPVSEITDQYLDYVQQMKEEKLEVASEFLVMAATLLDIKSRMLLPREEKEDEEEEGDPREELVQRLLDYKLTRYQSEELKDKSEEASRNVFRSQDLPPEVRDYQPPVDYDELLGDTTLKSLTRIFEDVLKRQKNRMDPVRSTFGKIRKEEVSIEDRTAALQEYFSSHTRTSFRALLEGQRSRQSLIVTFLILLDFIKSGIVHIRQSDIFGEIEIFSGPLPVGGMGPQETMPSNKAEARALRKARKIQEKEAAGKAGPAEEAVGPAEEEGEEEERERLFPEIEPSLPGGDKTAVSAAVETASCYRPRVILTGPGKGTAGQDRMKDAEVFVVTRVTGGKAEEELPMEEDPPEADPDKEGYPEDAPAEAETPEDEHLEEGYIEEHILEEIPSEKAEDDTEAPEDEESAVYRLIRSKDWEDLLDEYMEDEGLAELLEEEKEAEKEKAGEEPGEDKREETPETKEEASQDLSGPDGEIDVPQAVSSPRTEESLDRKLEEAQDTAVKEPAPQAAQAPEDRAEDLPEETSEEEWKKVRYLQPSRLYCSPWADRWKCPRSRRPWRSRKKMPGRQWKRSGRSLAMRAAACRSIATTMPYSSLPGRNTTNI